MKVFQLLRDICLHIASVVENINSSDQPIFGWMLVAIGGLNLIAAVAISIMLVMRWELGEEWTKVLLAEIANRDDYVVIADQIRTIESAKASSRCSYEGLDLPPIIFASPQSSRGKRAIRQIKLLPGLDVRVWAVFAGKEGAIWRCSDDNAPTEVLIEKEFGRLPGVLFVWPRDATSSRIVLLSPESSVRFLSRNSRVGSSKTGT